MKQVIYNNLKEPMVVRLNKNETQTFVIVSDGSSAQQLTIELAGEGAQADIYGLFFGKEQEKQSLSEYSLAIALP
jgi:hypothetical protein